MPSSTGKQESKMKPSLPSLHVRLPSTDSGIQADASGFDSLSRYKGKHFLSSSGSKMDSSPVPSTVMSDLSDISQNATQSPCSSSGYSSEARGATPPTLSAKPSRSPTPPSSASPLPASSSSKDSRPALPASMTSSWAGTTSFSKSKPQPVEIQQVPSRTSAPTGNEATGKMKRSTIHIPPKPKVPPPKRPTAPAPSPSAVKMTTSDDGIKVSISRTNPSAVQSSAQNASTASHMSNPRPLERQNSDDTHSQSKTTIDVRPASGSTVKVKVISGGGSRPQPQPRSTTSPARQGQGCIPLTRPLRVAPPSSACVKRATPRKTAMSQPPPPPPHSEQLQQIQQRHHQTATPQTGSKPRPLAPKPQVSPRKTFLTSANHPRSANVQTSGGGDSSSISATSSSSSTTCITSATITSTSSKNSNASKSDATATSATTSSMSSRPINVPISSKQRLRENTPNIKIKPRPVHDSPVHKSSTTNATTNSSPSSASSPRTNANKTPLDSCTVMFKSPEKSFFSQTFYSKDSTTKASSSSETPTSPKPLATSLSGKPGAHDHRHLGFIRDDLKAGDKQSRMRHAELILKRSDELFKDAWSFLNASDEDIDRCFFNDDFFKSHSPTPERTSVAENTRSFSPGFPRTPEGLKVVNGKDSVDPVDSLTSENKFPTTQMAGEKGELIPWKTRKERIDSALSWLKKELASLRDMDKNIVNQFRRCQDTIETLKNQREIWEGLSEEGEEADYWDDLEINEFNRNYLNSPEGSSLSPMSTGSRDLAFQEISTVVSLPVPQHSPTKSIAPSLTGSVTQDVEATL